MRINTLCYGLAIVPLVLVGTLRAQDNPGESKSTVVAVVNGNPVTLGELEQKRADNLFHARYDYYQAERKALDQLIEERILEDQARRENLTVDQLLQKHVYSQIKKDPTDEQMEVFYESLDTAQPFEAVRGTMLEKLREFRINKARTAYIASLKEQSKVAVTLPEPRAELAMNENTPVRGSKNAPVMVVEFADYQCPYCKALEPQLEQLKREFGDKVSIAFKDFPIPQHANAQKMAEIAHCAGDQGKYWELHDFMFNELKAFDMKQVDNRAQALNMDVAKLNQCVASDSDAAAISANAAEGRDLGVTGTPTVFINGRYLTGNAKYEVLRDIVQQELAGTGSVPQQTAQR